MKMTPAACAIEAFGGVRETARVLGIDPATVNRWVNGGGYGRPRNREGLVPIRHIRILMDEARARGKPLTLEHLVFGREPVIEGVVVVKDGRKVKVKMHDSFEYMTASLTMAGG